MRKPIDNCASLDDAKVNFKEIINESRIARNIGETPRGWAGFISFFLKSSMLSIHIMSVL